jgi:hypothetical protein
MTKIQQLKTRIAARIEDLRTLNARNLGALSQEAKREHRLSVMDAEGDIADWQKELTTAEADELSAASVALRARGRQHRDAAIAASISAAKRYAKISALLAEARDEAQAAEADQIKSTQEAMALLQIAPASTDTLDRHEEIIDVAEVARGTRPGLACSLATDIKALIEALSCSNLIKQNYLPPESMAMWSRTSVEDAAKAVTGQLRKLIGHKAEEHAQSKVAA